MPDRYIIPPVDFQLGKVKTVEFELSKITIGADTHEHYEGEYEITPRMYGQTMNTGDKVMDDDITILPIPVAQVSNPQGGRTATIG